MSGRTEFLAALKAGLRGAPITAEVIADYSAYFDEGAAANRSEADIAAALGDPILLADELLVEQCIRTFSAAPSPRSAVHVLAGAVGLGIVNIVIACVAVPLLAIAALVGVAAIVAFAAGGVWFLFVGSTFELPGGMGTVVLAGVGLLAAAVSLSALLLLAGQGFVSGVGRYARLRFRLLPRSSPTGKTP
jgi:uncharacterized membrane protein